MVVARIPADARAASRLAASPGDCSTSRTWGGPTTCTSASPTLFSAYVSRTGSIVTRTEWKPVVDGLTVWDRVVSPAARSACELSRSVLSRYQRTVALVGALLRT